MVVTGCRVFAFPAPVDPAPVDPAPVDPEPVDPAPGDGYRAIADADATVIPSAARAAAG